MAQNPSASASASVELLPDWGVPTHPLRDAMGDQPPAYRVQPVSVPLENEKRRQICADMPAPNAFLRKIPRNRHATQYPDCKLSPMPMTKISTHHHDDLPENGIRLCTTKPASATNVPRSSYAFFVNVPSSPLGPGPGFSLKVNCQMGFPPDRDSSSKIKISKVLEEAKMWLCPHVKLNDSWVVDAIYGLFYPRERFDDPIEQYRAE